MQSPLAPPSSPAITLASRHLCVPVMSVVSPLLRTKGLKLSCSSFLIPGPRQLKS